MKWKSSTLGNVVVTRRVISSIFTLGAIASLALFPLVGCDRASGDHEPIATIKVVLPSATSQPEPIATITADIISTPGSTPTEEVASPAVVKSPLVEPYVEVPDLLGTAVIPGSPIRILGGEAIISDPGSKIGLSGLVSTEWSGVDWIYWAPLGPGTRIFSKAPDSVANHTWIFGIAHISAPSEHHGNAISNADEGTGSAQWEVLNGRPSGILDTEWQRGEKTIRTESFTQDDVAVVRFSTTGINELRSSFRVGNSASGATGWVVDGPDSVVVFDGGSIMDGTGNRFLVMGVTNPIEMFVGSAYQTPQQPFDTSNTSSEGSDIFFGLGSSIAGADQSSSILMAVDDQLAEAIARVRSAMAVGATRQMLASARAYWNEFLSEVDVSGHDPREKYSVLVGLNQIRAHMVGDHYLSDGTFVHPYNWVRDAAFAAMGAAYYKPDLARDILSFFAVDALADIVEFGQFAANGQRFRVEFATDRAATFLWAVGETYALAPDLAWAEEMREQVNLAIDYYSDVYDEMTGHITAEHTHDWWDQYQGSNIDVSQIQYEAEIDVLASKGLAVIIPMLNDLGEASRATWAAAASQTLEDNLFDYEMTPGGSLAFAIKTNGSLYLDNGLFTTPPQLFAGVLFDRKAGYDEIAARQTELATGTGTTTSITSGRPAITDDPAPGIWGEGELYWEILLAGLDRNWGSGLAYQELHNFSVLGTLPVKFTWEDGQRIPGTKSLSFPWHYGNLMRVTFQAVAERGNR
ncbi:MAG: hypothetical protein HQ478_15680 [Chloroflexi bacterium]|nr:hypothetical protein [Chloroflexota bacterium]